LQRIVIMGEKDKSDSRALPLPSSLATRQAVVRLGLAFGLLISLLVTVGNLGLRRMDHINADLQDMMGKQWAKLRLSREAATSSHRNSRITLQIFLLKDTRSKSIRCWLHRPTTPTESQRLVADLGQPLYRIRRGEAISWMCH
jgi:hypothetical protein